MNKWINVNDRLPDRDTDVITWSEYFELRVGRCTNNGYWFIDSQSLPQEVIYWQPLPEAPSNKSDDSIPVIMQEIDSERLLMDFQQWQLDNPNDVYYNSYQENAKKFLSMNGASIIIAEQSEATASCLSEDHKDSIRLFKKCKVCGYTNT